MIRIRFYRSHCAAGTASALLTCAIWLLSGIEVSACNIPVFRYSLERWQTDNCQLLVFCQGKLSAKHEQVLAKFSDQGAQKRDSANIEVVRCEVGSQTDSQLDATWQAVQPFAAGKTPYAVLRVRMTAGRFVNAWHGTIEELDKLALTTSPARKKLVERIMAGDAVVWLMLKSADETKNEPVRALLKKEFARLAKQIKLPDGIGLPGSELYAEVPLLVQFSLVEIDPKDPREAYLVQLMSSIDREAVAKGEPMLTPVFGRGRALEVLPASMLNEGLVEDLTIFLCGACSCQVKEKNPGFDLLIDADWETMLFGEDGQVSPPIDQAQTQSSPKAPVLLTIPPGRKK